MNSRKLFAFILAVVGAAALGAQAQDDTLEIHHDTKLGIPPTPITITGFTGEAFQVLKFDLTVMGFSNAPAGSANYELSGSSEGNVIGRLSFSSGGAPKSILFSRSYQGGSLRAQAHRLADDVVLQITGVKGIAEHDGQISKIAFKVEFGPTTSEIYVSDFDGHDAMPATRDHSIVAAPCWVPGRFALYYTSYQPGEPCVYFQDLRSGERRNFTRMQGVIGSPAVSPDGRKVALVLAKSGSVNIYVKDADGSDLKQLTFTTEDNSSPCWSPNGQWICFASKVNERRALSKVSVDGGPMTRIITAGVSNPSEPDWSPDGKWIAFTSQAGGFNLCVVPADGGEATLLVAGEDPSWAANSRTLVFVRRGPNGTRTLSVLDVPTKQVKDVPRVSGSSNSEPSWAK